MQLITRQKEVPFNYDPVFALSSLGSNLKPQILCSCFFAPSYKKLRLSCHHGFSTALRNRHLIFFWLKFHFNIGCRKFKGILFRGI